MSGARPTKGPFGAPGPHNGAGVSQRRHRLRSACAAAVLGVSGIAGCASQTALKGVESRIANKIDNSRKIDAKNVETFVSQEADKWVARMLVLFLGAVALCYPVGKVLWIFGQRAKDAAAAKASELKLRRRLGAAGGAG